MRQLTVDRLSELTTCALERTAFVLAEQADDESASAMGPVTHVAKIKYSGPSTGEVYIGASEGFLRELASSLLGIEPDEIDPQTQGRDALQELANIIGGSIILELGGEDCRFSLGLPELTSVDSVPAGGCACVLDSEGERLDVRWCAHAEPTAQAA